MIKFYKDIRETINYNKQAMEEIKYKKYKNLAKMLF